MEERAVRAALDLQEEISKLSAKCEEESWPALNTGRIAASATTVDVLAAPFFCYGAFRLTRTVLEKLRLV